MRIRKSNFFFRNSLLWVVPYFVVLIVCNMLATWALLDLTGLGWVPPFHLSFDAEMFRQPVPGKWIVFPTALPALIEHLLLQRLFEVVD